MGSPDSICWEKAILVSDFRFKDQSSSVYYTTHVHAEGRALPALGRFVPYYLMCAFSLSQRARDWYFMCIPSPYYALQACQGLTFKQEPVFSYKVPRYDLKPGVRVWAEAYIEHLLRLGAAALMALTRSTSSGM